MSSVDHQQGINKLVIDVPGGVHGHNIQSWLDLTSYRSSAAMTKVLIVYTNPKNPNVAKFLANHFWTC